MRFNVKEGVNMQVSFNPNISFKQQPMVQNIVPQVNTVYIPQENKKSSGFREDISKVAKFFTTLSEMTKATIKAVGYGTATAGISLAGFWAFGTLPRSAKTWKTFVSAFKNPVKNISKKGKIISTVAALGVASYQLIKGKLKSNQRTANVDHQLKTGHRAG